MKSRTIVLVLCGALLVGACGNKAPSAPDETAPAQQTVLARPADALAALRADMKQSYTGFWRYENGMLYLSLNPEFEGGALPHFQENDVMDILEQPKG